MRKAALIVTFGVVSVLGVVAIASAGVTTLSLPLTFELGGHIAPKQLPRHAPAPVAVSVSGEIAFHGEFGFSDEGSPPALREAEISFDRSVAVDVEGLAVCRARQIRTSSAGTARQICRESIVGTGLAHIALQSPGQEPLIAPVQLAIYNGGKRAGVITLFIHGSATAFGPEPIFATVKLRDTGVGRYGLQALAKFPPIAEGNGSLLDFKLEIKRRFGFEGEKRSFLTAKCPDGRLVADFERLLFRQEFPISRRPFATTLRGTVSFPCTPSG